MASTLKRDLDQFLNELNQPDENPETRNSSGREPGKRIVIHSENVSSNGNNTGNRTTGRGASGRIRVKSTENDGQGSSTGNTSGPGRSHTNWDTPVPGRNGGNWDTSESDSNHANWDTLYDDSDDDDGPSIIPPGAGRNHFGGRFGGWLSGTQSENILEIVLLIVTVLMGIWVLVNFNAVTVIIAAAVAWILIRLGYLLIIIGVFVILGIAGAFRFGRGRRRW